MKTMPMKRKRKKTKKILLVLVKKTVMIPIRGLRNCYGEKLS